MCDTSKDKELTSKILKEPLQISKEKKKRRISSLSTLKKFQSLKLNMKSLFF